MRSRQPSHHMLLVLDGATEAGLDHDGSAPGLSVWRSGRSCRPSRLLRSIRTRSWPRTTSARSISTPPRRIRLPCPARPASHTRRCSRGRSRRSAQIAGSIAVRSSGQIGHDPGRSDSDESRGIMNAQTLLLIDPKTLRVLASKRLPPGPSGGSARFSGGGGYFYLNNQDQVVCVTITQRSGVSSSIAIQR